MWCTVGWHVYSNIFLSHITHQSSFVSVKDGPRGMRVSTVHVVWILKKQYKFPRDICSYNKQTERQYKILQWILWSQQNAMGILTYCTLAMYSLSCTVHPGRYCNVIVCKSVFFYVFFLQCKRIFSKKKNSKNPLKWQRETALDFADVLTHKQDGSLRSSNPFSEAIGWLCCRTTVLVF